MKYATDIVERIKSDFGDKAADVINIFDTAIAKTEYISTPRVIRCILFLAERNVEKLNEMIEAAQGDPRDVMLWAEYEGIGEPFHPKRIRDFNKMFDKSEDDVSE